MGGLIGRARELDAVTALLANPSNRHVSIVGMAGVGKTRLAEAAVATIDGRAIVRVALANVTNDDDVAVAVAGAFGLPDLPPTEMLAVVAGAAEHTLVMLDNVEQLPGFGTWLGSFLAVAPSAQVLVTSRVALGIATEHVVDLSPLALDDGAALVTARASERRIGLGDLAPAISAAADNVPLAIELAVARLAVLSPAQLVERLQRDTSVLGSGLQRSLDASHELLNDNSATLFRRLAIFAGSPSLDAIEAVCLGPDGVTTIDGDVLDALTELVDAHLIERGDRGDETRFAWLRVVREYAATKLRAADEGGALALAHAAWACCVARDARRMLATDEQGTGIERFEAEREELLGAVRWSLDCQWPPTFAAELVGLQRFFWLLRGQVHTGGALAEQLLVHADELEPAARSMASSVAGDAATARGDLAQSLVWASAAVDAAEMVEGNLGLRAEALTGLARAARNCDDHQTALDALRRVLPIADGMGSARNSSTSRANLAGALARAGEVSEGLATLRGVLANKNNGLTPLDEVITLGTLADVAIQAHEYNEVVEATTRALSLCDTIGDGVGMIEHRNSRSQALRHLGDVAGALVDADVALKTSIELDEAGGRAHALVNRAAALALGDRPALAVHALADALRAAEQNPAGLDLVTLAIDIAATGCGLLPDDVVATLLATRTSAVEDPGVERRRRRARRDVLARLGTKRAATAAARAATLDVTQIVDLALRGADAVAPDATVGDRGGLTPRELDVLRLVARGLTDKEIAAELTRAPRTVTTHVGHILTKLGSPTRTAAAARAAELDLL